MILIESSRTDQDDDFVDVDDVTSFLALDVVEIRNGSHSRKITR